MTEPVIQPEDQEPIEVTEVDAATDEAPEEVHEHGQAG